MPLLLLQVIDKKTLRNNGKYVKAIKNNKGFHLKYKQLATKESYEWRALSGEKKERYRTIWLATQSSLLAALFHPFHFPLFYHKLITIYT